MTYTIEMHHHFDGEWIVESYPTIELAKAAVHFLEGRGYDFIKISNGEIALVRNPEKHQPSA